MSVNARWLQVGEEKPLQKRDAVSCCGYKGLARCDKCGGGDLLPESRHRAPRRGQAHRLRASAHGRRQFEL